MARWWAAIPTAAAVESGAVMTSVADAITLSQSPRDTEIIKSRTADDRLSCAMHSLPNMDASAAARRTRAVRIDVLSNRRFFDRACAGDVAVNRRATDAVLR